MEATPVVAVMFIVLLGAVVYDYVRLGHSPWAK